MSKVQNSIHVWANLSNPKSINKKSEIVKILNKCGCKDIYTMSRDNDEVVIVIDGPASNKIDKFVSCLEKEGCKKIKDVELTKHYKKAIYMLHKRNP